MECSSTSATRGRTSRTRWLWRLHAAFLVSCIGESAAADLASVGPVYVDFGAIKMGTMISIPVRVRNLTASTMTFAGGGFTGSDAFFASNGTCGGGLAAGATCNFVYTFRPPQAGTPFEASTSLSVVVGGSGQGFALTFAGTGTDSLVQLTPRHIDFGNWLVGQQVIVPVTVTNTHSATVSFGGGGFAPGPFTGISGTCGSTLAAGAICHFDYRFIPATIGTVSAATSVGVSAASPAPSLQESYPITVTGTGVASVPIVGVAPVSIGFGKIKIGTRASVPFPFTNQTAQTVSFGGGGFGAGSNGGGAFSSSSATGAGCNTAMGQAAPGATCTGQYMFEPRVEGVVSGNTSYGFSIPGTNLTQPINVSGEGTGTLAQLSPRDLDFGRVAFGTTLSVPVTLTNTSGKILTSILGGSVTQPFSSTTTCGTTLAVGASCVYTYSFNAGSPTANLGATESRQTLISFTNSTGIQPVVAITMTATRGDRVFGDGFDGDL